METEFPWNFEQEPWLQPHDETDVNLRSYFDRMPQQKMSEYRPSWSDDQVVEWDGNFRSDGALFLICSERDVEVGEYRRVLEQCREYRAGVAPSATNSNAE
jgi:hypothetical protein